MRAEEYELSEMLYVIFRSFQQGAKELVRGFNLSWLESPTSHWVKFMVEKLSALSPVFA